MATFVQNIVFRTNMGSFTALLLESTVTSGQEYWTVPNGFSCIFSTLGAIQGGNLLDIGTNATFAIKGSGGTTYSFSRTNYSNTTNNKASQYTTNSYFVSGVYWNGRQMVYYCPVIVHRGSNYYFCPFSFPSSGTSGQGGSYSVLQIPQESKPGLVSFTQSSGSHSALLNFSVASASIGNSIMGNLLPDDPYEQLDVPLSSTGGGIDSPASPIGYTGIVSDSIDFPTLQTFSVSDAGFMSIWCPTLEQLQDLSYFVWNADPLTVEFWKRIVSSPLEMILGLMILPYSVPQEDLHEDGDVYLGYKKSGIKMNYTTKQFVSVDCGSIDIKEVWGSFLDYSPYTKISIYLPYIGVHTLDADEIMNKTIQLKYYIDLCTGSCVAVIKSGDSCLYTFNGNCAVQIPVTTAQHADALKALLSIAGSSLQMGAVGGVAGAAAGAAIGGLTQLENIKPKISHSGSLSATNGYMAPQTPYLIFSRPKQAQPEKQSTYTGYPSFITSRIGELSGYTEIEIIHLHNMTCTEEELKEIDSLLSEGVII